MMHYYYPKSSCARKRLRRIAKHLPDYLLNPYPFVWAKNYP